QTYSPAGSRCVRGTPQRRRTRTRATDGANCTRSFLVVLPRLPGRRQLPGPAALTRKRLPAENVRAAVKKKKKKKSSATVAGAFGMALPDETAGAASAARRQHPCFRELAAAKERELHELYDATVKSLDPRLISWTGFRFPVQVLGLRGVMQKLQEDFLYNLALLEQRDQELDSLEVACAEATAALGVGERNVGRLTRKRGLTDPRSQLRPCVYLGKRALKTRWRSSKPRQESSTTFMPPPGGERTDTGRKSCLSGENARSGACSFARGSQTTDRGQITGALAEAGRIRFEEELAKAESDMNTLRWLSGLLRCSVRTIFLRVNLAIHAYDEKLTIVREQAEKAVAEAAAREHALQVALSTSRMAADAAENWRKESDVERRLSELQKEKEQEVQVGGKEARYDQNDTNYQRAFQVCEERLKSLEDEKVDLSKQLGATVEERDTAERKWRKEVCDTPETDESPSPALTPPAGKVAAKMKEIKKLNAEVEELSVEVQKRNASLHELDAERSKGEEIRKHLAENLEQSTFQL
ncbi:MAG: hypothetical protein BJ554DRAFT_765, partial [Olpidium bornovanus]